VALSMRSAIITELAFGDVNSLSYSIFQNLDLRSFRGFLLSYMSPVCAIRVYHSASCSLRPKSVYEDVYF
jgi:hypothetical protein